MGKRIPLKPTFPLRVAGTAEAETLDGVRNDPFLAIGIRIEQELDSDEVPTLGVLNWNLTCPADFN